MWIIVVVVKDTRKQEEEPLEVIADLVLRR
jgi:hypothetical protein